jgi:hypothetical protein
MRKISTILVAAAFVSALLTAQTKPNFSGTWKVNVEKSDFGPFATPEKGWSMNIDHREPEIWTMPLDDPAEKHVIYTDGRESQHESKEFGHITMTATWDKTALLITSKYRDIKQTDRWVLSADGKTLTSSRHLESPMGDGDLKHVYEKQEKL